MLSLCSKLLLLSIIYNCNALNISSSTCSSDALADSSTDGSDSLTDGSTDSSTNSSTGISTNSSTDNSTDGSAEIAKKFDWKVIKNEKNLGHGGNLKKAIHTAFVEGADYAIEIHADNQYSPNEILKAKDLINENSVLLLKEKFHKDK